MPVDAAQELQSITLRDKSKTAVILGATTGIGAAVARAFAKLGCSRVVISGRDELRARDVLDAMRGSVPEDVDSQIGFVKRDLM